jgi:hypothetical protein
MPRRAENKLIKQTQNNLISDSANIRVFWGICFKWVQIFLKRLHHQQREQPATKQGKQGADNTLGVSVHGSEVFAFSKSTVACAAISPAAK